MSFLSNIIFAVTLIIGVGFFVKNVKKIIRNIKLGQKVNRTDNASARWKNMALIALGQKKCLPDLFLLYCILPYMLHLLSLKLSY